MTEAGGRPSSPQAWNIAHRRDGHRVGAHAVSCSAAGGVGSAGEGGNELTGSGPVPRTLELPRGIASVVKMILVQSVALVELQLDLQILARQWFATDSAALPAPRSTQHSVRASRGQLPTPDRFAGLLSEDGLVRHDNSPSLAEVSYCQMLGARQGRYMPPRARSATRSARRR